MVSLRVLSLNAYHGGSHRAFLDGWKARSRHQLDVLSLPAYKWKWRMRHAAITFAQQLSQRVSSAASWDVLFCTDMLNLAEFRGLCPPPVARLPAVVYFHENQLTYPQQAADDRDLHFGFTNFSTALSADRVWFNSAFHRDEFLDALSALLRRMPDYRCLEMVEKIRDKSDIRSPGIEPIRPRGPRQAGPLHILWAARWEHDKDPDTFFAALRRLRQRSVPFRLSVVGQSFGTVPQCFARGCEEFESEIEHWGYLPDSSDYLEALRQADVVVSTARHEFFGIAVLEAVAAGCFPVVPRRLAYPEVLGDEPAFFHDGTAEGLSRRLEEHAQRLTRERTPEVGRPLRSIAQRHSWPEAARRMDEALQSALS